MPLRGTWPPVSIITNVVEREPGDRQDRGDPVAAVEDVHRVLVLAAADEEHGHDRGQQAEGTHDEREEDPGLGFGQPQLGGDAPHGHAQDHGADVLGRGRLEQVGAAAGAVADVVADEVGDHAPRCADRLPGCPLRPCRRGRRPRRPPWCRYRRRAGRTAPRSWRRSRSRRSGTAPAPGFGDAAEGREDAVHAEQRQGHDQEAGDGAAAHGDLHRVARGCAAPPRRCAGWPAR